MDPNLSLKEIKQVQVQTPNSSSLRWFESMRKPDFVNLIS